MQRKPTIRTGSFSPPMRSSPGPSPTSSSTVLKSAERLEFPAPTLGRRRSLSMHVLGSPTAPISFQSDASQQPPSSTSSKPIDRRASLRIPKNEGPDPRFEFLWIQPSDDVSEFVLKMKKGESDSWMYDGVIVGSCVAGLASAVMNAHSVGDVFRSLWMRAPALVLMIWFFWKRGMVHEESILIMRDVGIQTRSRRGFGARTSTFVPISKISQVIVNEGITLFQVRYYIAIVVAEQKDMVVVFESFLPKLRYLKPVFWELRRMLYGDTPPVRFGPTTNKLK